MAGVKYVAHRGFSMNAPENTLAAFELAGRSGFWGIECDTYCTTDGRWIVHHDRTVDRMTNGTGKAKDFSFEEIRKLAIVSGHNIEEYPGLQIPTLEEVLAVCKRYGMYAFVEIEEFHKDDDVRELVDLVERSGMMPLCRFICFKAEYLRMVRNLHKDVPLGYLSANPPTAADIELVRSLDPAFLDYDYAKTTAEDVHRCREAGIEMSLWTVNTREEAQPFIEAGADYITTDTKLF